MELSSKLSSVTGTQRSAIQRTSYAQLAAPLKIPFLQKNILHSPNEQKDTSLTTKFNFICPMSVFYFLIHLSGTAFNTFGFFFLS